MIILIKRSHFIFTNHSKKGNFLYFYKKLYEAKIVRAIKELFCKIIISLHDVQEIVHYNPSGTQ